MSLRCAACRIELSEDEAVWANEDGVLDTWQGLPWCDACLPYETRTCDGCGKVEPAWTLPDQDGDGRSVCCWDTGEVTV